MTPYLIRRKNFEEETLHVELLLEEEYSSILVRMTSENTEEIFQLLKDDIPKEKTKLREIIPPRL